VVLAYDFYVAVNFSYNACDSWHDGILLLSSSVLWITSVSVLVTVSNFLGEVILVVSDVFLILVKLVLDQPKFCIDIIGLNSQVSHYWSRRQLVQRLDHCFWVSDKFGCHRRVKLVMLDELGVISIDSVLIMWLYDTLPDDVLVFSSEWSPISTWVDLFRVMQMLFVNKSHLMNDMLVR